MSKIITRDCQPCTGCCDGWVSMTIKGEDVFPGRPCQFSSDSGCTDYDNRPIDPCKNFICGWAEDNSPLPEWLKPNNAKMIIVFNKFTWMGYPVDLAIPIGKRIPPRSLNWFKKFSEENGRPMIYTEQIIKNKKFTPEQQVYGFGPTEFQEQVLAWQNEGKKLW